MGGGWGKPVSQLAGDLQAQYAYNPTLAKQLLAQAGSQMVSLLPVSPIIPPIWI